MNNTEKRLRNAGYSGLIGYSIKILSTSNIVVIVNQNDRCEPLLTDALVQQVIKTLSTEKTKWGGFRAAGGHWYLEKNYDPRPLAAAMRDHTGGH